MRQLLPAECTAVLTAVIGYDTDPVWERPIEPEWFDRTNPIGGIIIGADENALAAQFSVGTSDLLCVKVVADKSDESVLLVYITRFRVDMSWILIRSSEEFRREFMYE